MTGLTDAQRSDFRMMKDLMAQTAVKPEDRIRHLATFIRRIKGRYCVLGWADGGGGGGGTVLTAEAAIRGVMTVCLS